MPKKQELTNRSVIETVLERDFYFLAKHLYKLNVEELPEKEVEYAKKVINEKIAENYLALSVKEFKSIVKEGKLDEDKLYAALEDAYKKAYKTTVEEFTASMKEIGNGRTVKGVNVDYSLRELSREAIDKAEEMLELLKNLNKHNEISKL